MTPEEVAKLAAAATPGPWRAFADETAAQVKGFPRIEADNYEVVGCEGMYGHYETDWANAAFIAAAHDMADLIAEQARMIAELRAQQEAADALAKLTYEAKSLGYFNTLRERIFAAEMQYRAARGTLK